MRLVFAALEQALTELCGWPAHVFRSLPDGLDTTVGEAWLDWVADDGLDGTAGGHGRGWHPTFVAKGLVFDFETGDLLKLDAGGGIAMAYHGLARLSDATIAVKYPGAPSVTGRPAWGGSKWAALLSASRHPSFFVLLTYFDAPSQLSLCQGVQWVDTGCPGRREALPPVEPGALPYSRLWVDHNECFNHIFDNVEGMKGRGSFFRSLQATPSRYLLPRPQLASWLHGRRAGGVRTVLATNSHCAYARFTLRSTLGPDWESCFDLVFFACAKPVWFVKCVPWLAVEGDTEGEAVLAVTLPVVTSLAPALQFFGGSAHAVATLLGADKAAARTSRPPGARTAVTLRLDAAGHVVRCGEEERERTSAGGKGEGLYAAGRGAAAAPVRLARGHALPSITAGLTDAVEEECAVVQPLEASEPETAQSASARVLYVGDHLHGDVHAASAGCRAAGTAAAHTVAWDALAVVEELEEWPLAGWERGGAPRAPPMRWASPWGSLFEGPGGPEDPSHCGALVRATAVAALPDVALLAEVGSQGSDVPVGPQVAAGVYIH